MANINEDYQGGQQGFENQRGFKENAETAAHTSQEPGRSSGEKNGYLKVRNAMMGQKKFDSDFSEAEIATHMSPASNRFAGERNRNLRMHNAFLKKQIMMRNTKLANEIALAKMVKESILKTEEEIVKLSGSFEKSNKITKVLENRVETLKKQLAELSGDLQVKTGEKSRATITGPRETVTEEYIEQSLNGGQKDKTGGNARPYRTVTEENKKYGMDGKPANPEHSESQTTLTPSHSTYQSGDYPEEQYREDLRIVKEYMNNQNQNKTSAERLQKENEYLEARSRIIDKNSKDLSDLAKKQKKRVKENGETLHKLSEGIKKNLETAKVLGKEIVSLREELDEVKVKKALKAKAEMRTEREKRIARMHSNVTLAQMQEEFVPKMVANELKRRTSVTKRAPKRPAGKTPQI